MVLGLPILVPNALLCTVAWCSLIRSRTCTRCKNWILCRNMDIRGISRAEINDGVGRRHRKFQACVPCVSLTWSWNQLFFVSRNYPCEWNPIEKASKSNYAFKLFQRIHFLVFQQHRIQLIIKLNERQANLV